MSLRNGEGNRIATVCGGLPRYHHAFASFNTAGKCEENMRRKKVNSEYLSLLRDPKWQKKRLEIMERDEFTCQSCFDSQSTLNVHHCYYEKGNKPWEYPNTSLVTLCESCHQEETESLYGAKQFLLRTLSEKGWLSRHFTEFSDCLSRSNLSGHDPDVSAVSWFLEQPDCMQVIRDSYCQYLDKWSKNEVA
jgi:5-methylcytosine-specific restriction endonuclease McrA